MSAATHQAPPLETDDGRVAAVYAGDVSLEGHDVLAATRAAQAREHLHCEVAERLERIDQATTSRAW